MARVAKEVTADERRVGFFWAKVQKTEGCWNWVGAKNQEGYGNFGLGNRKVGKAHQFSYELHKGPIPQGLELDHLCRNRACVNPDHLEAVTHKVNSLRSNSPLAIHARKTHCIRGHEFNEANTTMIAMGRRCRACWRIYSKQRRERLKAVANG